MKVDHYKWGAAETHLSIDFQFLVPPIITKIWENKHFESFQNRQKYRYSTIHVIIPPKFHRIVKLYSNLLVKFYYHQTFHLFLWVFAFMAFWSDDFFSKFVSIFTILAPRDSVSIFFWGFHILVIMMIVRWGAPNLNFLLLFPTDKDVNYRSEWRLNLKFFSFQFQCFNSHALLNHKFK